MDHDIQSRLTDMHDVPGRVLGIWSLVMAFLVPFVGLVLGIGATITTIAIWA